MVIFVLITGTIADFQIFETVMLITAGGQANMASSGGPQNMTNVMLLQIYKDAFVNLNLGRAGFRHYGAHPALVLDHQHAHHESWPGREVETP